MRVTSIQFGRSDELKDEAVARGLDLIDRAPKSDLLLLPEMWPSGFFSFDRYRADSEPLDGPTVTAMRTKAREKRCHLLMGSLVERDGDRLFNTSILIDPTGDIVATYRKMHLFGYQSDEKDLLTRGSEVVVAETPWGRCGIATCYDLRFPELFRKMVDLGATLFFVVSAWPRVRLEAWTLFNRARAHENLAYLISCNCAGIDAGSQYAGHSMIVDPLGNVVAEGDGTECFVSAEIDPELVAHTRNDFSALHDRIIKVL